MSDVIILDHLKEPTEEQFKKFIIGECRRMDRLDVYEWVADDELKIKQLQQENKQLKEKVGELTQSLNEQMKETNKENLDCSKYAIENQQLKDKINTYENPEDLTLMFMYCDEKAKDKIKQLKEVIKEVKTEISSLMSKYFYEKDFCIEDIHLDKLLQILDKVKGE